MTIKTLKTIVCVIATLCLFCSSLTAFAENGDLDFDFNIQPEVPTTVVETEKPTEEETEKPTEKETEKETKKETEKPTKAETTKAQAHNNNNNNSSVNVNTNTQSATTTEEETTEPKDESLPEGAFYVYLERNNGQKRLKTIMEKPGYVNAPEEPVRVGYVFDGWYTDPNFKNPWDFLKDKTDKEITIYAKWKADDSTVVFDIIIKDSEGGVIEANPSKASMGEPITLTIKPEKGKRLVKGSLCVNGESTDFLSFIMPKGEVVITAAFEDVPDDVNAGDDGNSKLPLFIGIGVVVVIILVVAIIIALKRRDFNADLDPDDDYTPEEDDYYDNWIDETIVVEDGFKEGKKVVENTEPDYGAPDLDEDDE